MLNMIYTACFQIEKRRYQIVYAPRVSRITFIRYAQSQSIWKPNNFKIFGSKKTKGPNEEINIVL